MESSPEPSTAKPDSKTWKEKIEDNPIWYIGRIAAACFVLGFGAGYGAYDRHLAITKTETISRAELESLRRSAPTEQINTLKSDIAQKDNKIAQVNAQLAQKSNDLEVLTERCNKLESQRNSYEAEMKKNQQLIADLRSQRDAQSKQITGLKKQIQEAADQRKSDQAEIAKSQELLKNQAEEVNRLKDQLKTSRSKVGAGEKGPPTVQTPRAQMHGFTFEAIRCRTDAANVYCEIRITNNLPYEQLLILGGAGRVPRPSYLYDQDGRKYQAKAVRFGNDFGRDQAAETVPPGVSVVAEIQFEAVPSLGDQATIRIGTATNEWMGTLECPVLRNVPLSK